MSLKLLIFLIVIISFRFYFFYQNQVEYAHGQEISFETVLLSEPQIFSNQQAFTADLASGKRIRIVTSRFPQFHYADNLYISGTITSRVINDNRSMLSVYFPKIEVRKDSLDPIQNGLAVTAIIRQKLISLFSNALPSPSSSLLMGIIFGIKDSMPKDFTDNLRVSGVFHVIAASGMNVTLIGGFISSFFAFFLKRQMALVVSILGIIFYVILGGLEPSLVRASIMGILVFSAQILGRQSLAINGLILAGFAMLFVKPNTLFDIGFQLSFAATLGILYIKPFLENKLGIKSEIMTTIAAQITTLPILLANFGQYSIYSILVNALVLWTIPILMVIGGIGALVGLVFAPLGQLVIYFCYPLLLYFEVVVNFFGSASGLISIQNLPWQFAASYYCILASIFLIFRKKNKLKEIKI